MIASDRQSGTDGIKECHYLCLSNSPAVVRTPSCVTHVQLNGKLSMVPDSFPTSLTFLDLGSLDPSVLIERIPETIQTLRLNIRCDQMISPALIPQSVTELNLYVWDWVVHAPVSITAIYIDSKSHRTCVSRLHSIQQTYRYKRFMLRMDTLRQLSMFRSFTAGTSVLYNYSL